MTRGRDWHPGFPSLPIPIRTEGARFQIRMNEDASKLSCPARNRTVRLSPPPNSSSSRRGSP